MCLAFMLIAALPVAAFEVITAPENVNAVNLTGVADIVPRRERPACSFRPPPAKTASSARIEVLASASGTNPNWALFALRNDSDVQLEQPAGRAVFPPAWLGRVPSRSGRRAHQGADPQRRHPPGAPRRTAKPTCSRW